MRNKLFWLLVRFCNEKALLNIAKIYDTPMEPEEVVTHRFFKRYNRWDALCDFFRSFTDEGRKSVILRYKRWKIFGYLWDER